MDGMESLNENITLINHVEGIISKGSSFEL